MGDWLKTTDEILLTVNLMSAVALLIFVFTYFIVFHDGSMMTGIMIQGYGSDFTINYGMDIIAPIVLFTIFLASQIYLNLRKIMKEP
jgi:hypothetical protein